MTRRKMGFETLHNIIEWNKLQEEIGRVEKLYPTECPDDAWELDIDSDGHRSCPICERVWR